MAKSKSRKSRNPRAQAPASAPTAAAAAAAEHPSPGRRPFSELRARAEQARAAQDFDTLLALGTLPPAEIDVEPGSNLQAWLALQEVRGLAGDESLDAYDRVRQSDKPRLTAALARLSEHDPDFAVRPEFDVYLRTLGYDLKDALEGMRWLTTACRAQPSRLDLLENLRGRVLRIMLRDDYQEHDETWTQEVEVRANAAGEVDLILREALERAWTSELDDYGRLLVTALRADLDMRVAQPWEAETALAWAGKLETPATAPYEEGASRSARDALTPQIWALLWEFQNTPVKHLDSVFSRYPEGLGPRCDGLRKVVTSLTANGSDQENLFFEGMALLASVADQEDGMFGQALTVQHKGSVEVLPVGWNSFLAPSLSESLARLMDEAERIRFQWRDELALAAVIWTALAQYAVVDRELPGDDSSFAWLGDKVPLFAFQAAHVHALPAQRLLLMLRALHGWLKRGQLPPTTHVWADLEAILLSAEERAEVRALLGKLAVADMAEPIWEVWLQVVGPAFVALCNGFETQEHAGVLALARQFRDDLEKGEGGFRLGYLEQLAGSSSLSLESYLSVLADEQKASFEKSTLGNLRILLDKEKSEAAAAAAVTRLTEAALPERVAEARGELLKLAKARLAALKKEAQYEKTAVNRWPSIGAPARKLLGVLAQIQTYSSMDELADYAHMEVKWVRFHYEKLVDTGMIFESAGKYRINPHIAPLVEQEDQHKLVGRIIRAQGTSTVKQVFNSGLEFRIYQIMTQLCPNHLVFPNCALQSFMKYELVKELVTPEDFNYYLLASVDLLVVNSTTYMPMLAIEVDSIYHDTERQQKNDGKKDRLFATAGVPFLRLRPVGSPSEQVVRGQVAEHLDELVRTLRPEIPGYAQARMLLEDLSGGKLVP
ncbi:MULTISPECIES: DUF2726 domain-containing protein [unclassified Variovorax]|uniref:DUF2726 domain-containing protein n=1 Tax=unclassified Variovorax TaxID=663243 RepID=UPI0009FFBA78|nr:MULTISPECIES: DUF2726 domain-containing protein [unclassified Variovorax]VTV17442.1 hypothetical protein WDL1P1_00393 [Variovorax sp. WDL1]